MFKIHLNAFKLASVTITDAPAGDQHFDVCLKWSETTNDSKEVKSVGPQTQARLEQRLTNCSNTKIHFFLFNCFPLLLFLLSPPASDRGREKNGKMRPKSEGFELYNSSVQNGSPESPQPGWDSYPEPKKMSGEDRLLKNRADHRSSPNVASKLLINYLL